MARGPDAFFYGFTGIINHRFLTNQITRTISVILFKACSERIIDFLSAHKIVIKINFGRHFTSLQRVLCSGDWELLTNNETNFPTDQDLRCSQKKGSCPVQAANTFINGFHEYSHKQA